RLDGGPGSDTIFGLGGDDRIWGDSGPGLGLPSDVDRLFAGQGNDDVIGGQGTNFLYAWSQDPNIGGVNDSAILELRFEDGLFDEISAPDTFAMVESLANAPIDGILSADAHFTFVIGDTAPVDVVVRAAATNGQDFDTDPNETINDLIADINESLKDAGVDHRVVAERNVQNNLPGQRIVFRTLGTLVIFDAPGGDPSRTQLGFVNGVSTGAFSIMGTPTQAFAQDDQFVLNGDSVFTLISNNGSPAVINLKKSFTDGTDATDAEPNQSISDLVADLNRALRNAGIADEIIAGVDGSNITLSSRNTSLRFISQFGVYVDSMTGAFHSND
ncbi:MAG: hypothetical protein ACKVHO_25920, partial [Verrucomicrobiia bacterium]